MKKRAFTLVEILLALGIVGAVAALTIPGIMNNINKQTLTNQLKNVVNDVSYLVDEQLLNNSTKNIGDTDFKETGKLLSHFEYTKICSDDYPCWADSYKKLSDMSNSTFTAPANTSSAKLKNGASLYYTLQEVVDKTNNTTKRTGLFVVDVNGTDGPNVVGRDLFEFKISDSGQLPQPSDSNLETFKTSCQGGNAENCFKYMIANNWNMDY